MLIDILLFPGVVFHELAHFLMCIILGIRVTKVNVRLTSGFVEHVVPRSIIKSMLVAVAPSLLAAACAFVALGCFSADLWIEAIKHYLVFVILYESIPSKTDTKFYRKHHMIKQVLTFPLFVLFRLFYFFTKNRYTRAVFCLIVMLLAYGARIFLGLKAIVG